MSKNIENKYTESISSLVLLYIKNQKIGYIHSIFKDSLNIKFGNNLIYISTLKKKLVSFGCRIKEEKILKIIKNIKIGDRVIIKNERFIFYTNNEIIEIDLPMNKIENLEIPRISSIEHKQKILQKLFKNIKNIDFKNKIGISYIESNFKPFILNGLTEDIQKYFTGRGKGLTPSGDDILIGYSFICSLCGEENIQLLYGNLTTDVSKQYFDAFNRGYTSESLLSLLKDDIHVGIKNIIEIGHTSGYDTLLGIFLGIKKNLLKMEEII